MIRLANGRNVRAIAIVDDFTRECLALEVGFSLGSHDVIRCFEDSPLNAASRETIRFDNGSEFTSHAMLRGPPKESIDLHFIDPGKPTQNAQIESLNGKIRDELLNAHSFMTIFEARRKAAEWRQDYNEVRPHSALRLSNAKGVRRASSKLPNPHSYQLRRTEGFSSFETTHRA